MKPIKVNKPNGDPEIHAPSRWTSWNGRSTRRASINVMPVTAAAITLLLAPVIHSKAATISWTNAASGGWNTAANWNPNSVPGTNDTAIITNAGVTVSLN